MQRAIPLLSAAIMILGCDENETSACIAHGVSNVSPTKKQLVGFTLVEVLERISPIRQEAEWSRSKHVPEELAGTTTSLTARLAVDPNTSVEEVAEKPEDPSYDELCGDHLRAEVRLELQTTDGALDESLSVQLTAYGANEFVSFGTELAPADLSGNLRVAKADGLTILGFRQDGDLQGTVGASFRGSPQEPGLEPISQLVTLLSWKE